MGDRWLTDLADVVETTGLTWRLWPGWETRGRSSGGYDEVWAVFAHHTASSAQPDDDCRYMWETSADRPIGALYLDRTGAVTIGAAGATNTQGKGGPWTLSRGTIPVDKGNAYGIAVEAANNGVGEQWPQLQCDAYVVLVAALCDAYDLDPTRDVLAHWEWCQPSCPGRKVDPAGPSWWAAGTDSWNMDRFRADVAGTEEGDELASSDEILAQINELDERLTRVETWLQQIDDKIDADRVNASNRYNDIVGRLQKIDSQVS